MRVCQNRSSGISLAFCQASMSYCSPEKPSGKYSAYILRMLEAVQVGK